MNDDAYWGRVWAIANGTVGMVDAVVRQLQSGRVPIEAEQPTRTPEVIGRRLMAAGFSQVEAAALVVNPKVGPDAAIFAAVLVEGGLCDTWAAMRAVWK